MNTLGFLCLLLLLHVTSVSSKAAFDWAGLRILNDSESIPVARRYPHQRRRRNGEEVEVKEQVKSHKKKKEKKEALPRDKLEKEKSKNSSSYKMRKPAYTPGEETPPVSKDRCGPGRKNTNITTTFDVETIDEVYLDSHSGMRFQFDGDYQGTWIQTIVRISDVIRIGHDQLTFYDENDALVGVIATQFDSELDYALVTAGTGAFECAQGSPTIHLSNSSSIVSLHWDLCVCSTE